MEHVALLVVLVPEEDGEETPVLGRVRNTHSTHHSTHPSTKYSRKYSRNYSRNYSTRHSTQYRARLRLFSTYRLAASANCLNTSPLPTGCFLNHALCSTE